MKTKLILTCITIAILTITFFPLNKPASADSPATLQITNLSGETFNLAYDQIIQMPKTVINADLRCYGAPKASGMWGGVLLSYLLTQAQSDLTGVSVQLYASDGYHVGIPMQLAVDPQIIIAYELDGSFLPEGLRLVVPGANGAAWIAKITTISESTLEAAWPEAETAPGSSMNNQQKTNNNPTPTPTPTTQYTPIPTPPQNAINSNTQQPTPTGTLQPNQSTAKPPATSQNVSLQTVILYGVLFASAVLALTTAYLAYKRKHKLV